MTLRQNTACPLALISIALWLSCAHTIPRNEYGLEVVSSKATYRELVSRDASKALVDLETAIPGLRIDIKYATADNFMKRPLYPVARAFLRAPAADSLSAVQREFSSKNLELKVFDGYRPYSITKMMWEPYKDPDFVADPAQGSRHNRGCAVDVTIVRKDGSELIMPTPYDDFTPKARHDYMDAAPEALANRALLKEVMERHGFIALPSEWWHYDFRDWERFELLDVPLDQLP
ncbi:MAG TPA: M15 family metallopeptidase [Thermoanaerobaculia bacterium]|nr:M15 family metallopeptidase [Thermoanaerobaculia bacterium]